MPYLSSNLPTVIWYSSYRSIPLIITLPGADNLPWTGAEGESRADTRECTIRTAPEWNTWIWHTNYNTNIHILFTLYFLCVYMPTDHKLYTGNMFSWDCISLYWCCGPQNMDHMAAAMYQQKQPMQCISRNSQTHSHRKYSSRLPGNIYIHTAGDDCRLGGQVKL